MRQAFLYSLLVMSNRQFLETLSGFIRLNEFLEMFEFFCFDSFCRIIAGRYGLSQVDASTDSTDSYDDDQDSHDDGDCEHRPFTFRKVDFKDVQEVGPENHDDQENPRKASDPEVAGFAHGADDNRRNGEGDDSQQLVGYTENRPNRGQVAVQYEVTPCCADQSRCEDSAGFPVRVAEFRPYMADEFLEHVTTDTGTSIDDGHDEQGFKHDAEVIPVVHEVVEARQVREDVSHADSQGNSTARTMGDVFTDHFVQMRQVDDLDAQGLEVCSRRVDSEVIVRYEGAGCN